MEKSSTIARALAVVLLALLACCSLACSAQAGQGIQLLLLNSYLIRALLLFHETESHKNWSVNAVALDGTRGGARLSSPSASGQKIETCPGCGNHGT
jgi:hypothetical protein